MWWLMGLFGPKGHEATIFGEFGDKRKKTTLYLQQGSSHNLFKCMCVYSPFEWVTLEIQDLWL